MSSRALLIESPMDGCEKGTFKLPRMLSSATGLEGLGPHDTATARLPLSTAAAKTATNPTFLPRRAHARPAEGGSVSKRTLQRRLL